MSNNNNFFPSSLSTLKNKLNNRAMSVLIGAGFSKNFNNDVFPNWWELIFEMVRDGQETDLMDRYLQLYPKKEAKGESYEQFLKKRIEKYIENIGPLEAVSEFIRRKGYREAADIRIEHKTPYISIQDGIRYVNYNADGKAMCRLVTDDEILIHQKVVALPWNNIYTTNYDNLLESSLNVTMSEEFQKAIENLSEEIKDDQGKLEQWERELAEFNTEIEQLQGRIENAKTTYENLPSDPGVGIDEEKLKGIQRKKNQVNGRINIKNEGLKKKLHRLAELKRNSNQINSVVTHSSELALKKTGNIIKLHGSIRDQKTTYGFDNDARMHYVISKEDFENYPIKHEAFTQLMRISLLQESFCLLGFSGIDPNFLAWIGWVRDILEKRKSDIDNSEDKVYLIDIREQFADPEKEQFNANHRISFIPLGHPDCRKFLEQKTGKVLGEKPSPRDLISIFLDYLSSGVIPNKAAIAFERLQQEEYLQLWNRQAWDVTDDKGLHNFSLFEKTEAYVRLRKYNRIPANADNFLERHDILMSLDSKLEELKNNKASLSRLISFVTLVFQEQTIQLINVFGKSKTFNNLIKLAKQTQHEQYPFLLLIDLKDAVWANDKVRIKRLGNLIKKYNLEDVQQELKYLKSLDAFFNLRFSDAQSLLDNWEPKGHWVMKKAGMVTLTNPEAALQLLNGARQDTIQETVYQLQLERFINIVISKFADPTDLTGEIEELIHEGLLDVNHNIDNILRKLNKDVQKIQPYGANKFATTRTFTIGGDNEWALAQTFFKILAEFGFPLSVPYVTFKSFEKVHAALFHAYPTMPHPVLFYLFQYRDEKLIVKLAQDYSTNDNLESDLNIILENITSLFFDSKAPYYVKQNGLTFLSELINVIHPDLWEPFFIDVWKELKTSGKLFIEQRFEKHFFVEKAIRLIQTSEAAALVVNDTLMAVLDDEEGTDHAIAVRYLYELNFNGFLKNQSKKISALLNETLINAVIQKVSVDLEHLFLLGNINFLLTNGQQNATAAELKKADRLNSSNERIWRIVLYFANGDEKIINKIKSAILSNDRLWNAGFSAEGLSSMSSYISLYKLRRHENNVGISWTQKESQVLFDKMTDTLQNIKGWMNNHKSDHFISFESILEEMSCFLTYEENGLKTLANYGSVLADVEALYSREKGYERFMEGLVSTDKDEFFSAQNELFYKLYNYPNYEKYDLEIRTVLNKILLQSEPGLAGAMQAAVDWFALKKNDVKLRAYEMILIEILKQYQRHLPESIDVPFLESNLIILAHTLKSWNVNDSSVEKQLELLKTSRFMETRFNLPHKLNDELS